MPGFPTFDEKKAEDPIDAPRIVIAQVGASTAPKTDKRRKYIIISVSIILAALIILAAILIGFYMFTEAQKELVKYSLEFDRNSKQDVTSDPNKNIVEYQIQNAGQKTWVVNDFNKDIQMVKIQTATQTNCYLSALNRTNTRDPTQITGPDTKEINKASTLTYVTSGSPISDISFLAKDARDLCKGISTYWLYPKCTDGAAQQVPPGSYSTMMPKTTPLPMDTTGTGPVEDNSPWYVYWSYPYNANATVFCVTGCCKTVCACGISYFWYYSHGGLYCTWVASSCPTYGVYSNPVSQACTDGPKGLTCPNYSPAALPSC